MEHSIQKEGINLDIIEKKIIEIYNQIISSDTSNLGIGPIGGKSGIALFLFYYSKHFQDQRAADRGLELLHDCITEVEEGFIFFSYSSGLSGLGSVFQHLSEKEILDINTEEILGSFDEYLKKKMFDCLEENNIDFLHGALGVAYYFLKRNRKEIVLDFIQRFVAISKNNTTGIYWETEINLGEKIETGVNFGLAHGVFSIISFFNNIISSRCLIEYKEFLNEKLFELNRFVLNNRLADDKFNSFPTWDTPSSKMNFSRLSWCYGDLSAGLIILESAILMDDEFWYAESIKILRKTLKRVHLEHESVYDAGFCHGSCGLSHLYYKIFKLTNLKEFLFQSNYWLEVTFNKSEFKDGYAGYKSFHQNDGWSNEMGVLEGVAGIGLVLLARLNDSDSTWDNLLLI